MSLIVTSDSYSLGLEKRGFSPGTPVNRVDPSSQLCSMIILESQGSCQQAVLEILRLDQVEASRVINTIPPIYFA